MLGGRGRLIMLGLVAAALVALLCAAVLRTEAAQHFDARVTLSWLYALRGERPMPQSVVVIEMNEASGARLALPFGVPGGVRCDRLVVDESRPGYRALGSPADEAWPRCVHALLVDALRAAGARTIVFDVVFGERLLRDESDRIKAEQQDRLLAEALRRAGNVLIADRVAFVPCKPGPVACEERGPKPLTPAVRDAAAATGPMLVEHSSGQLIDSFLLFRDGGEPIVALPLLAWHAGRLEASDQLVAWLATLSPDDADLLPQRGLQRFGPGELVSAGLFLRVFLRELGDKARGGTLGPAAARMRDYYAGPAKILLNEYGPARTLPSLAYADALKLGRHEASRLASIVAGRTVFIGYAERHEKDVIEQFSTHFSTPTTVDSSGVDLLATAYANLEDGSALKARGSVALAGVAAGVIATAVCLWLPAFWGFGIVVVALAVYGAAAAWGFSQAFVVLPLAGPLAGAGLGFIVALATQYFIAARQRRRVFERLCQFVPVDVARKLAQPRGIVPESVQGVCLVTDAAGFSNLAERTESAQLADRLNRYFEILFRPVIENGGFVSDVIGDSMLAVWPHRKEAAAPIEQVLRACLAILDEIDRGGNEAALPTRIGVSAGPMTLTLVGALTHFEYRAVGDMVNATNRVQALNKTLGTRVLVTDPVARSAPGFVFRDLGAFPLPGRSEPQRLFELVGRSGAVDEQRLRLLAGFESARRLVELGDLDGARPRLEALAATAPSDGPTRYYLGMVAAQMNGSHQSGDLANR